MSSSSVALDTELATIEVLHTVLAHQRRHRDGACTGRICLRCMRFHLDSVRATMERGAPIEFVLPAFPAKSPNPAKVLSPLPDTAEELALRFLNSLCERIAEIYPPGARISICSDGRVFSDLIGVPDDHVTAYQRGLERMIRRIGAQHLSQFTLDDVYTGAHHDEMRKVLDAGYGYDHADLRAEVKAGGHALALYRGITRFMLEDQLTPGYTGTKAALQRKCRDLAYGVISRSKAWGDLLGELFPHAVRLSIHPQACATGKIGILLAETPDSWLTPWHSVAVESGGTFTLMKRAEAEKAGAQLVYVAGKPSYYSLAPAAELEPWQRLCA
ncbi:L-tyrosine/L-tryptophan isonitrile synthase family protein [Amycolatopsis sp. NPDC059657]|uniref:L-tyrosine/L-tryptophan isonitrile synthase family protein n=1 Tax=Amycolatopsis sp. NPDC059657 TaxID=3346899 RepID=UPI0036716DD0